MERALCHRWLIVSLMLVALVDGCSSGRKSATTRVFATTTTVGISTTTTVPRVLYRVRAGDTLSAIAQRLHVSASAIIERNRLTNPDRLALGQTLVIPPPAPLALIVMPARGHVGDSFELKLTGAAAGETIVYEIRSPKGTFKGEPHTASDAGEVDATYRTSFGDRPGVYKVTASGNRGTTMHATFRVFAALA
jgi:LysM repeat protein